MAKEKQEDTLIEVIPVIPNNTEVTLSRDIENNGRLCKKGEKIVVDGTTLEFLINNNCIEIKTRS